MSHAAQLNKDLKFSEIGALDQSPMGDSNLLRMLDNAGQAVGIRFGKKFDEAVDTKLKELATRGGWRISEKETVTAIRNIAGFHDKVTMLAKPAAPHAHDASALPKKDFHQFYSLIYHLTPDGQAFDDGREAIANVFAKLDMPPPIAKDKLAKNLPAILEFNEPGKKLGRTNG